MLTDHMRAMYTTRSKPAAAMVFVAEERSKLRTKDDEL